MIRRLSPLLMLAACAGEPTPSAVPPPTVRVADGHASISYLPRPTHTRPADNIDYVVDGVQHTDSSFRVLGLEHDDIESIVVIKCTDFCEMPSRIIIQTKKGARAPRPAADSSGRAP
jgi:hypothetical protein